MMTMVITTAESGRQMMAHITIGIVVPYVKHRISGDWQNSIWNTFLEF